MSHDAAVTMARAVRETIDLRRLPWIRPLLREYTHDFARVGALFAGNPAEPQAWRDTIDRLRQNEPDRAPVWRAIEQQQHSRSAPEAARAAAARLANGGAVAMVTGQQAGLLGGPLYTLLKAATTIQLARQVQEAHDVEVVPVFWVEDEDHDWQEIRHTRVIDTAGEVVEIEVADPTGAGRQPVSRLILPPDIAVALDRLADALAPTEFTDELMAAVRRRYREGERVSAAFAGWLEDLFGGLGLVVFEASAPEAKAVAAPLIKQELAEPGTTARLARERARALAALGHTPQVEPAEDSVSVFYVDDAGRHPIRWADGRFHVGSRKIEAAEIGAEALAHPERFSPNVLLRPIVQDRIFPTIAYVAGPAELAYQAQLGTAYEHFGIPRPLLVPRASATLLDGAAVRFFERSGLPLEALRAQDDSELNALLARQLPPDLDATIDELDRFLNERRQALKTLAGGIDPTLDGVADSTVDRMHDALKTLKAKIVQAAKRKDDTLRRQFRRAQHLTFPGGDPQERGLGAVFFANRHGLAVGERLVEALPADGGQHHVLTL